LSLLLAHNLEYLSLTLPQLNHKLSTCKTQAPQQFENDELDICIDGERFYNMDARLACQLQVQHFMTDPSHYSMQYRTEPGSPRIHQQIINNLNQKALESNYQAVKKPILSTLIMLGSGLGEQISQLSHHMTFTDIVIVEPNDKMLLTLLQHIDIQQLSQQCVQRGGKLTILQPESTQSFSQMILTLAKQQGFDFLAEITLFRHYNTQLLDQIFEQFRSLRYQWFSAWGFFDDELQGLAHTLSNLKKHIFVKAFLQKPVSDLPVLIVGNGPSLNNDLTWIKQRQGQYNIISCGTALATLLRNDIKPDIHVEMERSDFSALVQQQWFNPELTKNTLLLALNTVSPTVTDKFKQVLLFAKAKDLGSNLINRVAATPLPVLYYSNPTATNFATATAIALGFKDLILMGCDYGFRDPKQHHAKSSDYFSEGSYLVNAAFKAELEVEDTKGQTIYSTRIFNQSRIQLEALLSKHSDVNCLNCSAGAKIKHTQSINFHQLPVSESNKGFTILKLSTEVPTSKLSIDPMHVQQLFSVCQQALRELKQILSPQDSSPSLRKRLKKISTYLESQSSQEPQYVLLVGTFRYLSVVINGHMSRIQSQHKVEYEQFAEIQLTQLLEGCLNKLKKMEKEKLNEI